MRHAHVRRSPKATVSLCRKSVPHVFVLALTLFAIGLSESNRTQADDSNRVQNEEHFARYILPLLSAKCFACHGNNPEKIEGDLSLRDLESLKRGGASGMAGVVPGNPDESPILLAVERIHADWSAMPPKEAERVSSEQRLELRAWIKNGAHWPSEKRLREILAAKASEWGSEDGVAIPTSGGQSEDWTLRRYKEDSLWAYKNVKKPATTREGSAAIDELVEKRVPIGIALSPSAPARELIRRATLDLTGLPPTPEEITSFEIAYSSDSDRAMAELVDRLLESPHYGERMAQHWLDVVRYADSSGFANDYERGNAWRFRDYVVRAFNQDKPYNQFVREQIAGDELEPNNPEMLIAVGFLRMGPWELTGMEVAKVARQRFLDDVTNSIGETFLAHSLQCARCHDHKFDPIPTRDYYSIQAALATTQLVDRPAPFLPVENQAGFEEARYLLQTQSELRATMERLDQKSLEAAATWLEEKGIDPSKWNAAVEQAKKQGAGKRRGVFNAARGILLKNGEAEDRFPPRMLNWTPQEIGMERIANKGLERLAWQLERYEPFALSVYNGPTPQVTSVTSPIRMPTKEDAGELEKPCILVGGDPFSAGETVKPGVLSVLASVHKRPITEEVSGRRTGLADWIVDPQNPLTTRAIVNRIWMWHFDQPIAGNPNNFGSTGKRPTHPELLDWLAATLVENGWSIKDLHRVILCSKAYRRSSQFVEGLTPQQREEAITSYATFKPRRLTAEELRDSMLFATGLLNPILGGIPVRPEINQEAAFQPRQVMGTFAAAWVPNPEPSQRRRRSLYTLKLRGLIDPALEVFNAPVPDFSCERRENSIVTPQVFSLFHGQNSHKYALALAARALSENTKDPILRCYQLALGRAPSASERVLCEQHWKAREVEQQAQRFSKQSVPTEIVRNAVEENTGERFTYVERLYSNVDYVPEPFYADYDARTRALADVCLVLFNTNEFAYVY